MADLGQLVGQMEIWGQTLPVAKKAGYVSANPATRPGSAHSSSQQKTLVQGLMISSAQAGPLLSNLHCPHEPFACLGLCREN